MTNSNRRGSFINKICEQTNQHDESELEYENTTYILLRDVAEQTRLRTLRCMRRQLRRGRLAAAGGQAGARAPARPRVRTSTDCVQIVSYRLAIGLYVFIISLYRPTPALASLAGRGAPLSLA